MTKTNKRSTGSEPTTVILPAFLKDNDKLNRAISYGFNSRSGFFQKAMLALSYLIELMGLEKGVTEMQKRLEIKK